MIEISGWQVVTYFVGLVITIIGMLIGFGKILLAQFESKLNEKFKFSEERYRRLHDDIKAAKELSEAANKTVMELKVTMPNEYQRREDAIRSETVNSARFDTINEKLDKVILMYGRN
ncbi:hypothetical protein [Actinobacillus pleuropneumoniae]|uniref:Phage protein n=2 Tax=Actinobacillus pleuropneumoniae TaxID=715 RepID=A0ABM6X435_ACTPL|nr:hypothetical protein [Actinobacillus pleuropneumoniae]AWG95330.1 hypothetical protein APPSER1_04930 [Actinobacillus pleuropneumoniae serovar 1 str. 4074]AXA21401.1 hypothetical protein DRF63_04925 [Actinobacillus pleuropneumoniae]EFL77762.1 hypothetical protein APP2_0812 [Actinobacillus pleuropneumoniae serovar 2 str. 4226]MBL4535828.1 hypothetical protein [Actinobacillus pleuropneumoniae]MCI1068330.1 hypothetical protein [Actinobacillus pleuropneumoniae]